MTSFRGEISLSFTEIGLKSDQHELSLNNIKTLSKEKVRRSNKIMNKGEVL